MSYKQKYWWGCISGLIRHFIIKYIFFRNQFSQIYFLNVVTYHIPTSSQIHAVIGGKSIAQGMAMAQADRQAHSQSQKHSNL